MEFLDNIVHIQNLTPEISISEIKETYGKCGQITKIILGRTEALIFFSDEDEADSSLVFTSIGSVEIEINKAETTSLAEVIQTVNYSDEEETTQAENNSQSTQAKDDFELITKSQVHQEEHQPQVVEQHVQQINVEEKHEQIQPVEPIAVQQVHQEEKKVEEVVQHVVEKTEEAVRNIGNVFSRFEQTQTAVVEQPQPVVVEQPKPVVEQPKPVVHEHVEQPQVAEQSQPVVVEQPKPVVVEQPKPVVVEQPKPVVVEQPKPVVVEQPKHVEEPKLVLHEQPLAKVVEVKVESKPQVCPFERHSEESSSTTTTATTVTVDSVQLLKTLKNASLPERTKPATTDIFQNVFNHHFLTGLVGLLIAFTIFSQVF